MTHQQRMSRSVSRVIESRQRLPLAFVLDEDILCTCTIKNVT